MTITKIDLTTLSLAQLAAIYNVVAELPVKKFADRPAAVKRTERALAAAGRTVTNIAPANNSFTMAAEDNSWVIVKIEDYEATIAAAPAPVARKTRAIFGEDETIEINTALANLNTVATEDGGPVIPVYSNPKRKGSKAAARLQILIDAVQMTVGEYLDACVALEGDDAEDRFKYRRDIAWDIEHGFIVFPNGASED